MVELEKGASLSQMAKLTFLHFNPPTSPLGRVPLLRVQPAQLHQKMVSIPGGYKDILSWSFHNILSKLYSTLVNGLWTAQAQSP